MEQLRRGHEGDPWYGSARATILAGLSADEAAAEAVPGALPIWRFVLHMTAWTREVTRRLQGAEPAPPPEGEWPAIREVGQAAWDSALVALAEAHADLVRTAGLLSDESLGAPVGGGRDPALGTGVTRGEMLVGLAQHDAYHTGQIAVLRRALERRSPADGRRTGSSDASV